MVARIVVRVLRILLSQQRAVDNARAAATVLSARRVERLEVELFFDELEAELEVAMEAPAPAVREVLPG
jgi:hypothetical protein